MKHIEDKIDYLNKKYPYVEYKINDYVELHSKNIGEIVDIKIDGVYAEDKTTHYIIEILVQNMLIPFPFLWENIKRKLTEEEIEIYKINLEAKKYNI